MKTRTKAVAALVLAAGIAAAGVAFAQSMPHRGPGMHGNTPQEHRAQMHAQMHGKGGMQHGGDGAGHAGRHGAAQGDQSASSLAFQAVNEKMHRAMAIDFSGDADVDFARAMIPHHQGAIDMAKVAVAFGRDPEIRKLAEEVVKAQEAEIAFMREWLQKRGR